MKKILLVLALLALTVSAYGGAYQYSAVMELNFNVDSTGYPPDSVWASFWVFNAVVEDTAYYQPVGTEVIWPGWYFNSAGTPVVDSGIAICKMLLPLNNIPDTIQPAGMLFWSDANGFVTKESIKWGPPHLVHLLDTVIAGGGGGGSVGSGEFPETLFVYDTTNNALVQGAMVHIKAADTASYQNSSGPQTTNASGYAIFSIDAGIFPVAVGAQGYFQSTAYQLVTQADPGGRDTVFLYAFTPVIPSGSDSTTLVLFLPNQNYRVRVTPLLQEEGHADTSGVLITDEPLYASPAAVTFAAQVTVLRSTAASPTLPYEILVYQKDTQKQLLKLPRYITPDAASTTVSW